MGTMGKHNANWENWEVVRSFLPPGWEEQARLSGALQRTRGVDGAEPLLRILLLHLAAGCSLAETAVRARLAGLGQLSAVAVFKRLRAAGPWLRWLAQQVRGNVELPLASIDRRVRAVDATSVSEPGSTGSDWRIHYALNLANLQCDFFELTEIHHSGETFRRVPVTRGDIVLGDRVYAAPPGVAHVLCNQADVVVRWNRQSLPLFTGQGRCLAALSWLRRSGPRKPRQRQAQVKNPQGGWLSGRLIAVRRSEQATQLDRKKMLQRAKRSGLKVSPESWEMAEYFTIWSSLPAHFSATETLNLYRLRWQIELVFKRMKSILGLGHLPKKDPASAQAWLQGKLLVGLLIERLIDEARSISPWGYGLSPQPVA
jgi:hypothetical protein